MREPGGQEYHVSGTYRVVEPPRKLVYPWKWDHEDTETHVCTGLGSGLSRLFVLGRQFQRPFNFDYHVSFRPDEVAQKQGYYNFGVMDPLSPEREGISVFYKDATGTVYHTCSTYARGLDLMNTAYNYLDLTPKGRDEGDRCHGRPSGIPAMLRQTSDYGDNMATGLGGLLGIIKESVKDFLEDDCMDSAAALSYYTIFSLPAILVLLLMLVGTVMNPSDVRGGFEGQLQALVGPSAGEQVRTIIQQAEQKPHSGVIPTILSIAGLLFGATGAFGQLQKTLNRAWNVEPDPNQGGMKNFLTKRLFSFGIILIVAFFLLVSLVISAALTGLGGRLGSFLPAGLSGPVLEVLNSLISLGVITLLFAAMFKVMPDARITWRSVWVGAGVTAVLFVLGKFLIGFYLGKSNPGQAYGAAGSLAVLLLWIYYSSLILLFGAEFTETWARRRGEGLEPEPGAVRVRREKQRVGELGSATR